jgi:hypothetical protein
MSRGGRLVSPKPLGRRRLCRGASPLPPYLFFSPVRSPRVAEAPRDADELTGPEVGVESKVGPEYDLTGTSSRLNHSGGRFRVPDAPPLPVTLTVLFPRVTEPPRDVGELTGSAVGVESKVAKRQQMNRGGRLVSPKSFVRNTHTKSLYSPMLQSTK